MLLGLQLAFNIRENAIKLDTEADEVMREWDDWRWFINPRHPRIVEQLNQRLSVGNINLNKREIASSQNRLARYFAEDGAARSSVQFVSIGRLEEFESYDNWI